MRRRIAELEARLATTENEASRGITVSRDAEVIQQVSGPVSQLIGKLILGRDVEEEERQHLARYLHALVGDLRRLPLRALDAQLADGRGVDLARVYVLLATQTHVILAQGSPQNLGSFFQNSRVPMLLQDAELYKQVITTHNPAFALPDVAIINVKWNESDSLRSDRSGEKTITLSRRLLVTEATQQHRRLVLLGDPGSGKSTFFRHLAWVFARRGIGQFGPETQLPGWEDTYQMLPLILPLRRLAGSPIEADAGAQAVYTALRNMVVSCGVERPDNLLSEALLQGTAIVLLDGLDEVPQTPTLASADRRAILRAVNAFAERYERARLVLTCRTRAFDADLRTSLGWPVETLAPFTLGQVRSFVSAWYKELVTAGPIIFDLDKRLGTSLIDSIVASPKLSAMAEVPLLLTIMALVLFHNGELPRDRPQLYERILDLLLGQWDQVREGQSLGQAIGKPEWDSSYIRPLLDRLSYQAHTCATSTDGRGRMDRGEVYAALIDFFVTAQVPEPWGAARRCLDYIEQRSGLLTPDGANSYVFAHLTLQEHCAGRHIALGSEDPVAVTMKHRADDRWREPIFLGAGLMQPAVLNTLLSDLIDQEGKPVERWYRDLILAAELGEDRDWSYLRTRPMLRVDRLQRELCLGLVTLLADASQPLPAADRVRAGLLLGDLGDPRFPVTVEEWETELIRAGEPDSYFCRVDSGMYLIGSPDDDPDIRGEERPQHTFILDHPLYIARYPITNAQWQAWVDRASGQPSYAAKDANFNHPNQPAVAIDWYMANDFCTWLSNQIGALVRLPTEQEWEAAARGGDKRRYPWDDSWCDDHAATTEDCETRGHLWSVPVGCYPAGAAPCGALDMVGNIWEWTASVWQSYPGVEKPFVEERYRVMRGGSWSDNRTWTRCGARSWGHPNYVNNLRGFRVVVIP